MFYKMLVISVHCEVYCCHGVNSNTERDVIHGMNRFIFTFQICWYKIMSR